MISKKFGEVLNRHVCQHCRGNQGRSATVSADFCQISLGKSSTEVPSCEQMLLLMQLRESEFREDGLDSGNRTQFLRFYHKKIESG